MAKANRFEGVTRAALIDMIVRLEIERDIYRDMVRAPIANVLPAATNVANDTNANAAKTKTVLRAPSSDPFFQYYNGRVFLHIPSENALVAKIANLTLAKLDTIGLENTRSRVPIENVVSYKLRKDTARDVVAKALGIADTLADPVAHVTVVE